uniref:NADH dehydrogenase subunit 5 n=1 Tax=Barbatia decussata TaxID=1508519 RepID=UPI0020290448|nr:NADH dehydrogenase subunit 5 [Barbatia decussata]UQT65999.1 NADH dehydrogenase subunit 5 [Barbatia decussata]
MGVSYCGWGVLLIGVSAVMLVCSWYVGLGQSVCLECPILGVSGEMMNLVMLLDMLSVSFVSVVCLISGSVVIYSSSYMSSGEGSSLRFLVLLMFFVLSMNLLILFPSLLSLILGWDGLGVSSFLLVVYYQNMGSLASGMLTALSNRIGDGLIIVSMGLCLLEGSWSVYWMANVGFGACALMVVAGMTKSAQMPFCAWLPAAMAAPTPVSSLVHSSTLVTAGVYLMMRFSESLISGVMMSLLLITSSLTMIMAGGSAMFEGDSKKVVALSTLSQLGMMFFVLSMGFPFLCLFHVYMHAFLKALLFMGVGSMIHCRGDQDIHSMGSGWVDSPASSGFIVLACLSLAGFPFLCGFFSKDMIVEGGLSADYGFNLFGGVLFVGVLMTCIYSVRLCWLLVFSLISFKVVSVSGDCYTMAKGMGILALGVIFFGPLFSFWVNMSEVVVIEEISKILPILCLVLVAYIGVGWVSGMNWVSAEMGMKGMMTNFLAQMWFLPVLSGEVVGLVALKAGDVSIEVMEMGWVEVIGGRGVMSVVSLVGSFHDRCQSGLLMSLKLLVFSVFVSLVVAFFLS